MPTSIMQTQEEELEKNKRIADNLKGFLSKKINILNAFETPLIEGLMAAVKVEPLRCIGTILDASAKCYAYRVDNTFGFCYKALSAADGENKAFIPGENEDENVHDEGINDGDGGEGDDGPRTSTGDKERKGREDHGNNRRLRLENLDKAREVGREAKKLAEGLCRKFTKLTTTEVGQNELEEREVNEMLNEFSKDIEQRIAQRAGISKIAGSLDRKDGQYNIDDTIYSKVSKDFEEGSARSFISNEVLMNKHGNFMVLHRIWPGNEPYRPFPSLLNHLIGAHSQKTVLSELTREIVRARSENPSEFPLLTQICDTESELIPKVVFFPTQNFGERGEYAAEEDAPFFEQQTMEEHIGEDNTLTIRSPITLVDKTLVEDSTAGVNGQCNGEEQLSDFDMNVPNDGEYNEPFENGIENNLIDAVAFDEEGQAARLVDENLLPPTQMDFENIAATPLNTRIEDISHWKGEKAAVRSNYTRTPAKKGIARGKRNNELGILTKSTIKRRQQIGGDLLNGANPMNDMFCIPGTVASASLREAIAAMEAASNLTTAKKRLTFDEDAAKQRKQNESIGYDPLKFLRVRSFMKAPFGFWSYIHRSVGELPKKSLKPRFIPNSLGHGPFSRSQSLKEMHNEFQKIYFAILDEVKKTTENEEEVGANCLAFGDEGQEGGPIDEQCFTDDLLQRLDGFADDDDELDTGFGFLSNITLREIVQIYQVNFNVAKVKKAMLRVLSSQGFFIGDSSENNEDMDESTEECDEPSENALNGNEENVNVTIRRRKQPPSVLSGKTLFTKMSKHLQGPTKKNLNVTNAFAILLHLCNDKKLILSQRTMNPLNEEQHMSEFFVKPPKSSN